MFNYLWLLNNDDRKLIVHRIGSCFTLLCIADEFLVDQLTKHFILKRLDGIFNPKPHLSTTLVTGNPIPIPNEKYKYFT